MSSLHRFRVICHKICCHPYFANIILACILISSAMLAAEDPLKANSPRNQVSRGQSQAILGQGQLYWQNWPCLHIRLIHHIWLSPTEKLSFLISDFEIFWLFFYKCFYRWNFPEGKLSLWCASAGRSYSLHRSCVWIHCHLPGGNLWAGGAQGLFLSQYVQLTRLVGCDGGTHLLCTWVSLTMLRVEFMRGVEGGSLQVT